jgi:PAS domain S-box-containing protein
MNAYHRGLIEANLDPLVTIDAEGKISDANVATEHVTGYSRSQLVGTDFCDYFTDREKAREGYRHAFAFGTVRDYALEIRHRDGRVTPVLYNASVYRDDAGNVAGVFAAARDMAEVRRAEEQLRQAHKMEAVGTLAGGIAHDFNNMLAVIIGNAELALDDVEDDGPRQNLRQILNASKRSRDLVKQILAFSRSKTGGETTVKIVPLLKETYELLRASLPSTIRMKLNVRTKVDTAVVGDASKLQQVVINLANNAAHAMRETGGALTIGLSSVTLGPKSFPEGRVRPGSYVKLTMEDTGRGMTPEVRRRAFEPFFTTMEPGQGTGMGLSVVYGIVKGYNGTIEVKSEPGRGSTFTVLLPRSDALSPEEEQGEEETFHPSGNPHVLFVDDEPAVVEMTKIMLERMGYRVTAFTSSSEALKAFTRNPERFDLIITDQTMPDTTGVSLAKEILAVRQDMPIILCTGYSETVSPETAKKAGIRQFVMKPITKKEMAQAIHRALDEGEEE